MTRFQRVQCGVFVAGCLVIAGVNAYDSRWVIAALALAGVVFGVVAPIKNWSFFTRSGGGL